MASLCLLLLVASTSSTAGRDQRPPRILSAAMADTDRDASADAVRVTYSEAIRHVRDANGTYPFTVAGYRIRSVGPASRRSLVIRLVEQAVADTTARPVVRYRRTSSQPVRDGAGNQAAGQAFRSVRPHGVVPRTDPRPKPEPQPVPTAKDSDQDGYQDGLDCAPQNREIHPGAADSPDIAFVDANCDGIDGDEKKAIFVSPLGKDTSLGTKGAPKRQIQAAVVAAAAAKKDVYAAAGEYTRVEAVKGVAVYGGYRADTWVRSLALTTTIAGAPEGVLAEGVTGVLLQHLTVRGLGGGAPGSSVYGIRAVNDSKLTIQRVTVLAADAATGAAGTDGKPGIAGQPGIDGGKGVCDIGGFNSPKGPPTPGGAGAFGRDGGTGGRGGHEDEDGDDGGRGTIGSPGGAGGDWGTRGKPGQDGRPGAPGEAGTSGLGGTSTTTSAARAWKGDNGTNGKFALPGTGGGGGGGGGGQSGLFVKDGNGNDGGGGGGAGGPGQNGSGGGFGGGSFGIYLHDSALVAQDSTIRAGNGGAGGTGGRGGPGGWGGPGGLGGTTCTSEVGAGGNGGPGGRGGNGGAGGGGAGGPSVGVFQASRSSAVVKGSVVTFGSPGLGGPAGPGTTRPDSRGAMGIGRAIHPAT